METLEGRTVLVAIGRFLGRRAWGEGVNRDDGEWRLGAWMGGIGWLGPGFAVELLEAALSKKLATASDGGGEVTVFTAGRAEGVEEECLEEDGETLKGGDIGLVGGKGVFWIVEGLGGGKEPAVGVVEELEDFSFAVGFEFVPDRGTIAYEKTDQENLNYTRIVRLLRVVYEHTVCRVHVVFITIEIWCIRYDVQQRAS
jgi:hypothetical protein